MQTPALRVDFSPITSKLIRELEWEKTPLGARETWPEALHHAIRFLLTSPLPACVAWGKEYIRIYNDQYIPILGSKHPTSLGMSIAALSPARWEEFKPLMDSVLDGEVVSMKELKTDLNKEGSWEEAYLDLNFSPIYLDDVNIGGVLIVANDSTDRVRAIQAVRTSEQRFRDLISNAPVAISVFRGPEFICEVANKQYLPLIDMTEDEFLGKPLFESLPTAIELLPVAKNLLATGEPFIATEYPLTLKKKGKMETCYFTAIWEPVREGNKIDGFMAVVLDVTHQVEARKKIETSETRLKNLVSASTVPTAVFFGPDMVLQLVNEAMLEFWQIKDRNIIGERLIDFFPEIADQPFPRLLKNVYETGETYVAMEAPAFLNSRGHIYVNFSYKALRNEKGEIDSILVQATDVTESVLAKQKLIHSQESLRNTILRAPVGMCILRGPEYVVEIANERMLELWDKTTAEVLNKPVFEAIPEAKGQGFEELVEGVYTTGVAFVAEAVPINLRRNNKMETVYINFVYEAMRETNDTISGIIAVATDVTTQVQARHKIEEIVSERTNELGKANQKLQKSNAELAQFAYIASHDLQEPLRKIKTFTHLLEESLDGQLDEKSARFIGKINTSATRMNALIRDVLVYSQVQKEKELFGQVDLNKTLKGVIEDFDLLIEQKNATIKTDSLPTVTAIPLQMTQLFANIIGNALKFSRSGIDPQIRITVSNCASAEAPSSLNLAEGNYYKIQISDNGIGLKPEYSEQIFSIFQRLHKKSDYEGTGIGLALCKKILVNHNGDVFAGNSSESGAVFDVYLPVETDRTLA